MTFCGFEIEISYTANVHPDIPAGVADKELIARALGSIKNREADLVQYLFTRWRKVGAGGSKRPSWLYRSYPAEELT